MLPLALAATALWKGRGLAVIAAGGIYRKQDAKAALDAGAAAVQLDVVLWRPGGWVEDNV
jgi:NAD(P)H-dependent flavin oxidoreductase YrpB (nitropropane dioxygenase family)